MLRIALWAALAWGGPVEDTLAPLLEPAQREALPPDADAEALVAALTPEQKAKAREAVARAKLSPEDRVRVFRLLDDPLAAYRAEAQARGLLPTPAGELTAQASQALSRGDAEAAARFAAEALAKDPADEKAFGILKLTERRVTAEAPVIHAAALGVGPAGAAPPVAAFGPPSGAAQARMREAVAARRAGDMDATLRASLDAMRADPTSPEVQELYRLVVQDRAKQQARVQNALSLMEKAKDAYDAGRPQDADHLAREAAELDPNSVGYWEKLRRILEERSKNTPPPARSRAPKRKGDDTLPPLFPVAGGALFLTLGAFAWYKWGRDKASKLQRDAAVIAIIAGAGATAYFGMLAVGSMGAGGGGAVLATAAGPAVGAGTGVAAKGTALAAAAASGITAGAVTERVLPQPQYSYSSGSTTERKIPSRQELSDAGRVMDRNGLTKAGRSLQKHGDRSGSLFPKIQRQDLNSKGQEILDDILTDPKATFNLRANGRLEIRTPSGRGVSYNPDGSFRGFLDPPP